MELSHAADPDVLERVARQLRRSADDLEAVRHRSDTAVQALGGSWGGQDYSDRFGSWFGRGSQQLATVEDVLGRMSRTLIENARRQRETSGDGPVGPGQHGHGPVPSWDDRQGPAVVARPDDPGADGDGSGEGDEEAPPHRIDASRNPITGEPTQRDEALVHDGRDTMYVRDEEYDGGRRYESHTSVTRTRDGSIDTSETDQPTGTSRWRDHVDGNVRLAKAEVKAQGDVLGAKAEGEHGSAQVGLLHGEAGANAKAGIGKNGLEAAAGANVSASLVHGQAHYRNNGLEANAQADIGAAAMAAGGLSIGAQGLKAGVGGSAFAGGKVSADVSKKVGGVTAGVGGELSYGIGAHFDAGASLSMDKVGFNVDLGATLGIGAGIKFDVSVDPGEVLDDLGDTVDDVGGALGDAADAAGDVVDDLTPW